MSNRKLDTYDIKSTIRDIFSMARSCGSSHSYILSRMSDLQDILNERTPSGKRRYPAHVCEYASGYFDALYDKLWETDLEFVYRDVDGQLYGTHSDTKFTPTSMLYDAGLGSQLRKMEANHVWKHNGKPFSEWISPDEARKEIQS